MATAKKNATDYALMAGAFEADEKMAAQVCRLIVEGDLSENESRKMLRLIMDGRLRSEIQWRYYYTRPSTAIAPFTNPFGPTWTGGTITVTNSDTTWALNDGSLSQMANQVMFGANVN